MIPAPVAAAGSLTDLPVRVAGSVRRTSNLDILRPGGLGETAVLVARGREVRTAGDGAGAVLERAGFRADVEDDRSRTLTGLHAMPTGRALRRLVGGPTGSGFRARLEEVLETDAERASVLHQLLDDVPGITLIGGYARTVTDVPLPVGKRPSLPRVDVCAGLQRGGTMVVGIESLGRVPLRTGPAAPPVVADADPLSWHPMPFLPPLGMRRMRLLDVVPGDVVTVVAWFRDTFRRPDGAEIVVHEYSLEAAVDPASWRVVEVTVTPRVLPWLECPQAVPSADRLRGRAVTELRAAVRSEFTGVSTCTHLNDQFRSLADVPHLAARLQAARDLPPNHLIE